MTAPVIIIITRPPAQSPSDPLPAEVHTSYGPNVAELIEARAEIDKIIGDLS